MRTDLANVVLACRRQTDSRLPATTATRRSHEERRRAPAPSTVTGSRRHSGWADDEDVFPLILYGNEPVDWARLSGEPTSADGASAGAAAEAMEEAHEEERTGGGGTAAGVGGSGARPPSRRLKPW